MRSLPAVVLLLTAVPLFAQSVAKIDVRVINVDVSVVDASGKSVTGLKSGDFEILEDTQPEKVTNFSIVDHAAPSGDVHHWNDPQLPGRFLRLVTVGPYHS